jgi:hypothetical protein
VEMEPVAESLDKVFPEQVWLLPAGEEVPRARQVLMGMTIYYLATGEHLFSPARTP